MGAERGICPRCDRYVGNLERCPYCGSTVPKHGAFYFAKYGSVVVAVLGLTALLFLANIVPHPVVTVSEISQTYNYSTLTVKGRVSEIPSLVVADDGTRTMYIDVDDGTGVLSVHIFTPAVDRFIAEDKVPGVGEFVSVTGNLIFRGEFYYMVLDDPAQMTIFSPAPVGLDLAAINGLDSASGGCMKVQVTVQIAGVRALRNGAITMETTDGTGYLDLYIPPVLFQIPHELDPGLLMEGNWISVTGGLKWYGNQVSGSWELVPADIDDIVPLYRQYTLQELMADPLLHENELVSVYGVVASTGATWRLYDESYSLQVVSEGEVHGGNVLVRGLFTKVGDGYGIYVREVLNDGVEVVH